MGGNGVRGDGWENGMAEGLSYLEQGLEEFG